MDVTASAHVPHACAHTGSRRGFARRQRRLDFAGTLNVSREGVIASGCGEGEAAGKKSD